jgi:phytoene synthase
MALRRIAVTEENPDYALQKLVFAYAKPSERVVYEAVFALDSLCANIVATTSEALIGQMRLAWWRDVISKSTAERPAGHPLIAIINALPDHISSDALAELVNIWEAFLLAEDRKAYLQQFCKGRAEALMNILGIPTHEEQAKAALTLYCKWNVMRRTRLFSENNQYDSLWANLHDECKAGSAMPKTLPKPLKVFVALIIGDVTKNPENKPLFRPATAMRIIFYGLTS